MVCGSVQLQNEEEPGEAVPVVNDAPPPYSSISAESTGTLTWGRAGIALLSLAALLIHGWLCSFFPSCRDQD